MSYTYPDLDGTNFPNEVDDRYIMVDPSTSSDVEAIVSFQKAMEIKDFSLAANILENNERLQKMLFNAYKWNRHEDMIIAIERMWDSKISAYLSAAAEAVKAGPDGIFYPNGQSLSEKSGVWDDHLADHDNPHEVTPEQIRALALDGSSTMTGNLVIERTMMGYVATNMKGMDAQNNPIKAAYFELNVDNGHAGFSVRNGNDANQSRNIRAWDPVARSTLHNAFEVRQAIDGTVVYYSIAHDGNIRSGNSSISAPTLDAGASATFTIPFGFTFSRPPHVIVGGNWGGASPYTFTVNEVTASNFNLLIRNAMSGPISAITIGLYWIAKIT